MKLSISRTGAAGAATLAAGIAAVLAGCSSRPLPPEPSRPPPVAATVPAPAPAKPAPPPQAAAGKTSNAATPREYRRDAAGHLYGLHANRIYKGKMPPLLYAVGVLQVEIDAQGRVLGTSWMRAPNHAPEVVAEIERTVRQAAPYPAPARLGRVTYTDTWLWDKSGRFQLDTLTEGQL
jgi:periplasmic protein TonB